MSEPHGDGILEEQTPEPNPKLEICLQSHDEILLQQDSISLSPPKDQFEENKFDQEGKRYW